MLCCHGSHNQTTNCYQTKVLCAAVDVCHMSRLLCYARTRFEFWRSPHPVLSLFFLVSLSLGWGDLGYHPDHQATGRLVLDAQFDAG